MNWIAIRPLVALVLALGVTFAAGAQADDPRTIIAQAFAILDDARYRYTLSIDTTQALTSASGEVFGTRQVYEIAGIASGHDFQDTITMTVVPLEFESDEQTAVLERVRVEEALYVHLDELLADQFGVEAGWWLWEGLLDEIGSDSVRRVGAEQLALIPTPQTLAFDEEHIRSVTELAPSEVDGEAVREFDVELRAIKMALEQAGGSAAEQMANFLEDALLISQSEITFNVRLSIGVEDGRLVGGESGARTFLPFTAYGGDDDPDYDFDMQRTVVSALHEVDEPVEISVPAAVRGMGSD